MEQDYDTGLRLIVKVREEKTESKNWQLYCNLYPHFTKENFIPFSEFYKKPKKKVSNKPIALIIAEGEKLKKLFEKKG